MFCDRYCDMSIFVADCNTFATKTGVSLAIICVTDLVEIISQLLPSLLISRLVKCLIHLVKKVLVKMRRSRERN